MSTTSITPNTASETTANLRIATFAIATYDFLQTIPGEYRLYRKQWQNGRISIVCVLFVIVRYVSVACLILNAVGFWSTFTEEECKRFYLSPLMTKLVAGLACEGIIFSRTYAISRNRTTLYILSGLAVLLLPMQILGNVYERHPVVGTGFELGNCTAKRFAGDFNSAPLYYLANLAFDIVACTIATVSLLRRKSVLGNFNAFTRKVLKHGLLYAFAATLTNLLVALALFELPGIKVLGAFLSVAIIQIIATRLVLATAGAASRGSSDEDSSSWDYRDRSRSRSQSQGQRDPRRTIGSVPAKNILRSGSKNGTGVDSRLDRIELGGIRIHTETEVQRTTEPVRSGNYVVKSPSIASSTSVDDVTYQQDVERGEKEGKGRFA
ncbi:hypothetical protein FRC03_004982 [Tulasnella sp. 419]|nr:hypothetical protein FRC02_003539 [Tulasnella sp. 418]KAG8969015.1 hypothetical protein FRC03_004982 [Tulasnella sp. 419]